MDTLAAYFLKLTAERQNTEQSGSAPETGPYLQSVQETVAVLGNHSTAVYADTANFRCPYRVAGEQLIVTGNTRRTSPYGTS